MAKLRKLNQSTPFINFELYEEDNKYRSLQSDEEIAAFYHEMLSKYEGHPFIPMYVYEMISFSVNMNILIPRSL